MHSVLRRSRKAAGVAVFAAAVALAGVALLTGGASGDTKDKTVRSAGDEQFVPNAKIMATLRFSPGHTVIDSGATLTFEHSDKTEDPHTLSIVNADEVPTDVEGVFECGAPGTVCDEVFQLLPPDDLPPPFTNGPGTGPGIDGRLDTLVVFPGESASAEVTAPSGTTLHYLCAIHAWMQGEITVK